MVEMLGVWVARWISMSIGLFCANSEKTLKMRNRLKRRTKNAKAFHDKCETTEGISVGSVKRRTKNAKAFHDKCENPCSRKTDERLNTQMISNGKYVDF
ncbi:hypothetical protein ABLO03_02480, partial [Mycobacterium tuberculosis]